MSILGKIFAYIALLLLIVLCIKPIIRTRKNKTDKMKEIERFLVKKHVIISIFFLISLVAHVIISTESGFSLYTAKLSIVFLLLSLITISLKKIKPRLFIKLHFIFSILCLISAVLHIIEVKVL